MRFDELNNEELTFVYYLMKDGLDTFDDYIKEGGIGFVVDSPFGKVKVFKEFTDDELQDLIESDKYTLFSSVISKLKPIVELIAESDPDLIDKVEKTLMIDKDGDSSKEEDL